MNLRKNSLNFNFLVGISSSVDFEILGGICENSSSIDWIRTSGWVSSQFMALETSGNSIFYNACWAACSGYPISFNWDKHWLWPSSWKMSISSVNSRRLSRFWKLFSTFEVSMAISFWNCGERMRAALARRVSWIGRMALCWTE